MAAGAAERAAAVVAAYDFSEGGTVVDVGGGHGTLLIAILSANPAARGVLFERESVAAGARAPVEAAGLGSRCAVVAGDFFQSVPGDGRVYLLSHIIHNWDDQRCGTILANCRAVMSPRAKLLVLEQVLPERFEPSPEAVRASMAPATASLVALLDGSRGLRDVLVQSPLDAWQTLKLLVALQGVGALTTGLSESERRSALRFKVAIPIQYQGLGLWQEAGTFNLSAWGVFIRTAVPFDAGEQVLLRFSLPEREAPVTVTGRVIWGNPDPSKWGGMGMGIQFVDLAEADREAIEWHLAQRVAARLAAEEEPAPKDGAP